MCIKNCRSFAILSQRGCTLSTGRQIGWSGHLSWREDNFQTLQVSMNPWLTPLLCYRSPGSENLGCLIKFSPCRFLDNEFLWDWWILCFNFLQLSDKCLTCFPAKFKTLTNTSRDLVLNVALTFICLPSYWTWEPSFWFPWQMPWGFVEDRFFLLVSPYLRSWLPKS